MYAEEDLLPLSGLQHLVFCERQCALIHVEHIWRENALTVEGGALHARVDEGSASSLEGVRVARGLIIQSRSLGLVGRADVVEIGPPGTPPFPVEYKRGRRRSREADDVQLCAQAMCLEETWGERIPRGAVYHGRSRRRRIVELDETLREKTRAVAGRFHMLVSERNVPIVAHAPRCRSCSLAEVCMPRSTEDGALASDYLARIARGELP